MNVSYLNMYSINVFFEKELVNLESSILPGFNEESYIDYRTLDNSLYFEMVGKGLIHYSLIQSKVESYTTKFFISEQDLIFDNNEESMFFLTSKGIPIFEIGKPYVTDANGKVIFPSNIAVDKVDSVLVFTIEYDLTYANSSYEYPLKSINSIDYSLSLVPDYIRDKYVITGENSSHDGESSLHAGIDPFSSLSLIGGESNFNQYKTFIELNLLEVNSEDIVSAEIQINKRNLDSSPHYNPTIKLKRVINKTFDEIKGTTTYSSSNIATGPSSLTTYVFDITNAVKTQLNTSNILLLAISGEPVSGYNTGNAVFYATESGGSLIPSYSIVIQNIGATPYGSAYPYFNSSLTTQNCFGYALNINDNTQLLWGNESVNQFDYTNNQEFINLFVPAAMARMAQKNFSVRPLSLVNSDIYLDERRIAFRIGDIDYGKYIDFHFMLQHNNGQWSHKPGALSSILLPLGFSPNSLYVWGYVNVPPFELNFYYNSIIQYFAVEEL